jgi:hypothetical protein
MGEYIAWDKSGPLIKIYYLIVLVAFFLVLLKYRKNKFSILIILIFFNGLFAFYGKNLQNAYRIVILAITLYWLFKTDPFRHTNYINIIVSFVVFSLTFLFTSFYNQDYFFIIFSQYSRYFILFSLFFILNKYYQNDSFREWLEKIIYDLLFIQIILSVAKIFLIGLKESIVGSVGSQGGALATSLPMMGFLYIWVRKRGKLNREDWIFTLGLAFIGFISLKRAIWFIMPVLIALLMFFVPKKRIPNRVVFLSILIVPLFFYFGVRLNPFLNKEGKIWGSFDPEYAISYARVYSFGDKDQNEKGTGRGGAALLLFEDFFRFDFSQKDLTGHGLRFIYATDYEAFEEMNFGVSNLGSATGAFQTKVSNGYLGIIALVWFILSILLKIKNRRLKYVIIALLFWEYFLYTGIVIRELSLSFLLLYVVLFSDIIKSRLKVPVHSATLYET